MQWSLGSIGNWVISGQLLWKKGEWVFMDKEHSQLHPGSIVSILGLIQLFTNHRKRTGYKPVNLSGIFY